MKKKVRRLEALNEVIEAETARINQTMVGTVQRCLVEGISKKDPDQTASPYRQQPRGQLYRYTRHDQPNDRFGNHRATLSP